MHLLVVAATQHVGVYMCSRETVIRILHLEEGIIMYVGTCGIGEGWVGEPVGRGEPLILPLMYIICSS